MSNKKKGNTSQLTLGKLVLGAILLIGIILFTMLTGGDVNQVLVDIGIITPGPTPIPVETAISLDSSIRETEIEKGFGYSKDFWSVYFTNPVNSNNPENFVNGIDQILASEIDNVRTSLDIAAFELNNPVITEAIRRAHNRGVNVRIVTDDEHGIEDDDTTLRSLRNSGVRIVDDNRTALMHNKFMILDGFTVWTGSWNYTENGTYRNNNNALVLRSIRAANAYRAEFEELFGGDFGPRSSPDNFGDFLINDTHVQIYFAPENDVIDRVIEEIQDADVLRFYAFSLTENTLGDAILSEVAANSLQVEGVFETVGSQTEFSEMTKFFCAGLPVFTDGNPRVMHHKVMLLDDDTVILGSFNFSGSATDSNDENLVIIENPDIFELYKQEYDRVRSIASPPDAEDLTCL